ncbi:MAG: cell division protein ZapA [Ruminococcaceae bacterium]|nr:cell division protein ZapA [Oscillospiraceae bacterium]
MDMPSKMTIVINGKQYIINHTESEEYIHKIGKYVNRKIAETSVDGMKLVESTANVMACINIADDYFKAQRELEDALKEIETLMKEKQELEARLSGLQRRY